jgi:kynureninase
MTFENSLTFARQLDAKDPLASYRNKYHIPVINGNEQIYFCGNSLGLQPKTTKSYLETELNDWASLGVEGHFQGKNPWFEYHKFTQEKAAKVVGAKKDEVVLMNTLTTNLHLLMVSFYRPTKTRYKIVVEAAAFPSDHYTVESQARFHGYNPDDAVIQLHPRDGEECLRTEDILQAIEYNGDEIALVMLGGVNYYTGQFFELDKITKKGHEVGAVVGFDLAHAAGNIDLKLHDWNIDFGVWCTYKYLNSGPGGVGGIFVHEKHANNPKLPRFSGWWGYKEETRFQMKPGFIPMEGAAGWQLSNAQILPMAAHWAALDLFDEVGIAELRKKSELQSAYVFDLINGINERAGKTVFKILTPNDPKQRGGQISIVAMSNGKETFNHLTKNNIIVDWREPDVIRIAPVPMYNTFKDIFNFAQVLESSLTK